jgi:integrase/recombinase XerD
MTKRKVAKPVAPRQHFTKPYVEGFERWLRSTGYTSSSTVETIRLLAGWSHWMHRHRFRFDNIVAGLEASNTAFKGKKSVRRHASAGRLFVRYLREEGTLPYLSPPPTQAERWPIIAVFRAWAREQRGMANTTLDLWERPIIDLLKTLGDDPQTYTAAALRDFMLERAKRYRIGRLKTYAVALRGYLRFLIATGRCPIGREYAIPSIADWKLATIPRYLVAADIDRVIAACGGKRRLRDRAIVLLLVRLGLRAGEVANLKISDIDWARGRIAICAVKSRRAEWLPLTQEVGDAIVAYLEDARPRHRSGRLFLTEFAPISPITRITIKCLVARALTRAGVASAHRGAHVLRHSAATAMLRSGVSLAGVSTVLRHRSADMTMHYAKVDLDLLTEIAQPWIGRLPC